VQRRERRKVLPQSAVLAAVAGPVAHQVSHGLVHARAPSPPAVGARQQLAGLRLEDCDEVVRPHVPLVLRALRLAQFALRIPSCQLHTALTQRVDAAESNQRPRLLDGEEPKDRIRRPLNAEVSNVVGMEPILLQNARRALQSPLPCTRGRGLG
jgi:hypothetical protein